MITNFYEKIDKKLLNSYPQNLQNLCGITVPVRICFIAPTGGGKTNAVMNLLAKCTKMIHRIILVVKSASEPLYENLINKFNKKDRHTGKVKEVIEVYEDSEVPDIDKTKEKFKFVVFDDLAFEDSVVQKQITDYYIRGRKFGYLVTCYLSQNYHSIPVVIRRNSNMIVLYKGIQTKDLKMIFSQFSSNMSFDEFIELYRKYTDKKLDLISINLDTNTIYYNFTELISEI